MATFNSGRVARIFRAVADEPDLIEVHNRIGNDYRLWRYTADTFSPQLLFFRANMNALGLRYHAVADDFQWSYTPSGRRQCLSRLVLNV